MKVQLYGLHYQTINNNCKVWSALATVINYDCKCDTVVCVCASAVLTLTHSYSSLIFRGRQWTSPMSKHHNFFHYEMNVPLSMIEACNCADCHYVVVIMLSVIMLSIIMLSVIMLNVIIMGVIMLNIVVLSVVMLNVIILGVVFLNIVILSIVLPKQLMMICLLDYSCKKLYSKSPRKQAINN
jgi:hypothetical protein